MILYINYTLYAYIKLTFCLKGQCMFKVHSTAAMTMKTVYLICRTTRKPRIWSSLWPVSCWRRPPVSCSLSRALWSVPWRPQLSRPGRTGKWLNTLLHFIKHTIATKQGVEWIFSIIVFVSWMSCLHWGLSEIAERNKHWKHYNTEKFSTLCKSNITVFFSDLKCQLSASIETKL